MTKAALREAIAMQDAKIPEYAMILQLKKPFGERREEILQDMIDRTQLREVPIKTLGKLE